MRVRTVFEGEAAHRWSKGETSVGSQAGRRPPPARGSPRERRGRSAVQPAARGQRERHSAQVRRAGGSHPGALPARDLARCTLLTTQALCRPSSVRAYTHRWEAAAAERAGGGVGRRTRTGCVHAEAVRHEASNDGRLRATHNELLHGLLRPAQGVRVRTGTHARARASSRSLAASSAFYLSAVSSCVSKRMERIGRGTRSLSCGG